MKLTIDRATWLRGEGDSESKLLRERDGKMCCLGFYAVACNIPRDRILDTETPALIDEEGDSRAAWNRADKSGDWLFDSENEPSADCEELMVINDTHFNQDNAIRDQEREKAITEIFAKHGVEVSFIG